LSGHKNKKDLLWVSLAQASRLGSQLLTVIILARYLNPEDFGLMAILGSIIVFVSIFKDVGTVSAVIQRQELDSGFLNTVNTLNIVIGGLFCLLLLLISPAISHFFEDSRLTGLLFLMSTVFPITSVGLVHKAVLERERKFKEASWPEVVGALVSLVAAYVFARSGYGVLSLVYQALIMSFITSVLLFYNGRPYNIGMSLDLKHVKSVARFGGNLLGFNIINYFIRNADVLLIGKYLGMVLLGYYSFAYRFVVFPFQQISFLGQRLLLPIYSRKQNDMNGIRRMFVLSIKVYALVSIPMICFVFVTRNDLINILLGEGWGRVSDIIIWLAPASFLQTLTASSGPLLIALGRAGLLFKMAMVAVVVYSGSLFIGVRYGVEEAAASYLVANIIWFSVPLLVVCKSIDMMTLDVVKIISKIMIVAIIVLFSGGYIYSMLSNLELFIMLPMLLTLLSMGLVCGFVNYVIDREFLMDLKKIAKS